MYVPQHLAGAEMMLHAILLDLQSRGHEVNVLYPGAGRSDYEGVPYAPLEAREHNRLAQVRGVDVMITHLDMTQRAIALSKATGIPLVHLVHNDEQLRANEVDPATTALVAFNSRWLARAQRWSGRSVLLRPHVAVDRYRTETTGEFITLVNLTADKGAALFYAMAEAMPDRKFLAVRGGYGAQVMPKRMANVKVVRTSGDIAREVYARSRIVVMPSRYESWGRVAMEAACSGIPVIASPTPGLRESLERAALYAPPNMVGRWCAHVTALDRPALYAQVGARLYHRALAMEKTTQADLDGFAEALASL